ADAPQTSFRQFFLGTVSTRGAERRCSRRGICAPRPTPHGRATGRPRRALPSVGWLPIVKFSSQGRARAPSGARRARASVKSAPSNMRLKLTGALVLKEAVVSCPGGHRTFVHYSCAGGRVARSLSAIR